MKRQILNIVLVYIIGIMNIQLLYPQSNKIHFTNVGKSTNSQIGCNTHGSGFFDYNGDDLPDIFVVHNKSHGSWSTEWRPHTLLKNMGDGTFTNVTSEARVEGYNTSAQGFAAADYDNDGSTDMVIGMGEWKALLYRNTGNNNYFNVSKNVGVTQYNRGRNLVFVDYNNDGLLDLFVFGDDNFEHSYASPLLVYKNIGSGKFAAKSNEAGLGHERSSKDLYGCAFADIDNDGDIDFFTPNYESQCHLFVNNGNGKFVEKTKIRGLKKLNRFGGAIFLDYNNDGWFDLFTRRRGYKSILYKNNKDGTFTDVTSGSGLNEILSRPGYGGGLSVADFNNDGYIDILATTSLGGECRLYRNNGNGTFKNVAWSANIAEYTKSNYCAPIADYNGDGYLDIYLARNDSYPPDYYATLYENSGGTNHWIHVKLIGVESNRDAIGARVVLYTDGKLQMRQVLGGGGYKMDSLPVEFGLADKTMVDSMIVYWPSGIVQKEMLVPSDTLITIEEKMGVHYHSYLLSGDINYYDQMDKVPYVKIEMTGTISYSTFSDQNGYYKFPVKEGLNALDITPSKIFDSDVNKYVISAYDAALTARSVAGIEELTGISAKAADVNEDEDIDMSDPFLIARKAVGLSNINDSQAGNWRFDPSHIHIARMVNSHLPNQNFKSWLSGDVAGDFVQGDGLGKKIVKLDSKCDRVVYGNNRILYVSLALAEDVSMISADLCLKYDELFLEPFMNQKTAASKDYYLVYNDSTQGIIKIAMYGTAPLEDECEFLKIHFKVISEEKEQTSLEWEYYRINDTEYIKEDIIVDLIADKYSFSGTVKYYENNIGVPHVIFQLSGTREDETFTNDEGIYQFSDFLEEDSVIVTPSKMEGEDIGDLSISAFDAFLAARHSAGMEQLTGLKIEAADVDKNGSVEMSDAELMAKKSVGFAQVESSFIGAWNFIPQFYSCDNIIEDVEKDFTVYISGDINGDWFPDQSGNSGKKVNLKSKDTAGNLFTISNYEFFIPLSLSECDSMCSADIWVKYDESALELINISKTKEFENYHLFYNDSIQGILKIAMFNTEPVYGEYEFLKLYFRVISNEIEETTLKWKHYRINDTEYVKDDIIIDTGINDYSFSGKLLYYQDSTGVSETKLQMKGTVNKECFTNNYGYYNFSEVSTSDSIVVTPLKERGEDLGCFTISVYDAVLAARHFVGIEPLSGYKFKAADVDENGTVDMLDAVFIAERSVEIPDTGSSQAGAWRFSPQSRTCSYVFENIEDGNFIAWILGDVNGDWGQNRGAGKNRKINSTNSVYQCENDMFYVPLIFEEDTCFFSANISLKYDESVLELIDIKKSHSFEDFYLIYNDIIPGEVKIALFGVEPVYGKQEFIKIYFQFVSQQRHETVVKCESWRINNFEYNKKDILIYTGIDDDFQSRLDFKLQSNFPNPFNPETTINYQIEKSGQVRLVIYNSKGQVVRYLVDKVQIQGKYNVRWNGLDDKGNPVVSGLYFCRLICNNKLEVIKMVKLK